MLIILAIFSLLSKIINLRIEKENKDILPLNFGSDIQLPDLVPTTNSNLPVPPGVSQEESVLHGPHLGPTHTHETIYGIDMPSIPPVYNTFDTIHRSDLLHRRVPVERITRAQPNHRRTVKPRGRTWNPGLNTEHPFYNPVVRELQILRRAHPDFGANILEPFERRTRTQQLRDVVIPDNEFVPDLLD